MGRPQFAQPGTEGGGQVVATQSRPEIQNLDVSATSNVASGGGVEDVEIYAPSGAVYNLLTVFLNAGSPDGDGATSGHHRHWIESAGQVRTLYGRSTYTNNLTFDHGTWRSADDIANPANPNQIIQNILADENKPMKIRFMNESDVTYTQERKRRLTVEEVSY